MYSTRVIINNIFPPDQLPILEPQDFQERRTTQFRLTQDGSKIVALGARVHIFVQPALKDAFVWLFADVLACNVIEHDFGLTYPILFVGFPDGSGFSVEFSEVAPLESGTWIEFKTHDVDGVQRKLREAGVEEFRHPGSVHVYFRAPGGQVFRIIDVDYTGP